MIRVLLLATTTGYQTRAFGEAAERLGVELVFATDRCHLIVDPWQDHAIPIRFYDEDASVAAIVEAAKARPIDGVLVVGDRPTVIGARVARAIGLPGHPPEAAAVARHKQRTRERLRDAGLPVPWFFPVAIDRQPSASDKAPLAYPCVVKPVALSGSRGVMRADDPASFGVAFERLRALMRTPEIRAERDEAHDTVLVEGFIPGREYAVEGLLHRGALNVLAIFDKPDPLDGPFFEETIYVTPSSAPADVQAWIVSAVAGAAAAIGLHHGPVHAECRVNPSTLRSFESFRVAPGPVRGRESQGLADQGGGASGSRQAEVFVLEVAARPIGGLCARALRFRSATSPDQSAISLEELLLRHALGEDPGEWRRESDASGVMMIPIPRRGVFRAVEGIDAARLVPDVEDVRITAKPDQLLLPPPEGASYLGFIFARAGSAADAERALRTAHARLAFTIDPEFLVLT